MSRLTIDLTDEQHKHLKAMAAIQGMSIRQFATERLFPAESSEDSAWKEFRVLMNRRIEQAEKEGYSTKTVTEIFDEVLAQDEAA